MPKTLLILTLTAFSLLAGPPTGKRVASFALPETSGRFHDVLDYRGKILLIDIMKTDCPHCLALTKTLERVKAKYGDRVGILSIINPPDNATTVSNYIARNKVSTPILYDMTLATQALLKLGPQNPSVTLPHLLIVDANGIVYADYPYSDAQNAIFEGSGLFPIIDKLLAAKK